MLIRFLFYFSGLYLKLLSYSKVFLFTYNAIVINLGLTIKLKEV